MRRHKTRPTTPKKAELVEELNTLHRQLARLQSAERKRKATDAALRRAYDELEARVEERTATLTEAKAQLEAEVDERTRAEAALRRSEELFRQIAQHLRVTLFVVDHKTYRVLYVNPAYEETWNRTCESLYEHPASWIDAIAPEDAERVKGALEKQQRTGEFNEEFQIVWPDGSVRWIDDRVYPRSRTNKARSTA